MARFNPRTYDPAADSSPFTDRLRANPDVPADHEDAAGYGQDEVLIARPEGRCLCGCLSTPSGKGSQFAQGHDARYKGVLIRAHVTASPITILEGLQVFDDGTEQPTAEVSIATTAMEEAKRFGPFWVRALEEAQARWTEKAARRARRGTLKVGDPVTINLRGHEYTGQVGEVDDDGKAVIEYLDRRGNHKTVTRSLESLAEALVAKGAEEEVGADA